MDIIFLLILLILLLWLVLSLIQYKSPSIPGNPAESPDQTLQSPYEKFIMEHATDFNLRFQRKQLVKRKEQLQQALEKGNKIGTKIQKSMIVQGRSIINYLQNQFRNQ